MIKTKENMEKLAACIIQDWTLLQILDYVKDTLIDEYTHDHEIWLNDCETYKDCLHQNGVQV
jgi:hypothetical protein